MSATVPNYITEEIDPVRIFIGAIANEIHHDRYVFHKFPVSQYTNIIIPRLEKLSYLATTFPRSLACAAYLSLALWTLLLYPVLLLLQVALKLRHLRLRETRIMGDIFFATSKTSFLFSRSSGFKGVHICISQKLEKSCPPQNSSGSITDYLVLSDIAVAFFYSARALLLLNQSSHMPGTAFQVYAAFEWFMNWSVLNRSAGRLTSIWLSNDSDRWAVLVDNLLTSAKKIIVQHGLLCDPSNHEGFRNPESLPTRLKKIDKIVLFDKESEHKYRSMIIAEHSNTSFIFSNEWLIQGAPDSNDRASVRVMIIGQRVLLERECDLANYLTETTVDSRIFIKPYPGSSLAQYKKRLDCRVELIDDFFRYPYVELCICFDFSSLGNLYEKQGAKLIYLTDIKIDWQTKEGIRNQIMFISRPLNGKIQVGNMIALETSKNMDVEL